jgi:hypothetical protein
MIHSFDNEVMAGTGLGFQPEFTLYDAIGSHTCSLEASLRVINGIPSRVFTLLPVGTVIPSKHERSTLGAR